MQPLPGFRALSTHHCVTGSLRHIYTYHCFPIAEEMLFGLGAGLGFVYWHQTGALPMLGGRANVGRPGEPGLELDAAARTGVRAERHITGSARKAEAALLDLLRANEPVMLYVDMGFLPYFEFPVEFHFGGHAVVAAGLDEAAGSVLIADRDGLYPVSLEALAQARGSKFQPFPPAHQWLTFDFSAARPPTADDIRGAIRQTLTALLDPPIANLGVRGITTASKRVLGWRKLLDEPTLRAAFANARIFIIPDGGTGGGIFRYLYARFIHQAAVLLSQPKLDETAEHIRCIGDRWQETADLLDEGAQAAHPAAILPELSARLAIIAQREQAVWTTLREQVGNGEPARV